METPRLAATHLDEGEAQVQHSVQQFADTELLSFIDEMEQSQSIHKKVLEGLFENGFMGIEVPSHFGGAGLSFVESCIVIKELARVDPAIAGMVDIQNTLIVTAIRKFANTEMQSRILPKLAKDAVGSFCLSESGSGSDAFAMKTTAEKIGEEYVINGEKCWISNAAEASIFLVFANANPSLGHRGITAFIVERENPGLKIGKRERKLGLNAVSNCQLFLEQCKVHKSQILGSEGQGYKIAISLLNEGRIGIAAQMVGLAIGALDHALPYVHQRKQFGQPVSEFQGMQFQFAQAMTDIEVANTLMMDCARIKHSGGDVMYKAAIAKYFSSRVAERSASACIDWLGGVGFTKDFKAEKFYRDVKAGQIYEGTSNIQLQTIASVIQNRFKR